MQPGGPGRLHGSGRGDRSPHLALGYVWQRRVDFLLTLLDVPGRLY